MSGSLVHPRLDCRTNNSTIYTIGLIAASVSFTDLVSKWKIKALVLRYRVYL